MSNPREIPLISLPTEVILLIISHLPTTSILSLRQTCSTLHTLSAASLTTLHLCCFPKNLHNTLTKLDLDARICNTDHLICLTLPPSSTNTSTASSRHTSPSRPKSRATSRNNTSVNPRVTDPKAARSALLDQLSTLALSTLTSPSLSRLRTLSLHTWSPTPELLSHLSMLSSLRHLSLDFHHATHRHPLLPSHYWDTPDKPHPSWNSISGLGDAHADALKLRNLLSLRLERCGITNAQLQSWVVSNPQLTELRLKLVRGVDAEFVSGLGEREGRLEVLEMVNCENLRIPSLRASEWEQSDDDETHVDEPYEWISSLVRAGLRQLKIRECEGVHSKRLKMLNSRFWHLKAFEVDGGSSSFFTQPYGGLLQVDDEELSTASGGRFGDVLEVDPDCL